MGSLGLPEILLILLIALLIFGPGKLPEVGRTLGKGMAEFRKASNELKRTINTELALDENDLSKLARRPEAAASSFMQSLLATDEPATPGVTAVTVTPVALPAPSPEDQSRENLDELDTITGTVAREAAPVAVPAASVAVVEPAGSTAGSPIDSAPHEVASGAPAGEPR